MAYRSASRALAEQETATGIPESGAAGSVGGAAVTQGMTPRMRELLYETADALKIHPRELATIMSFETGGTLDPMQPGPVTKWGQHRGYIQFGEPQAEAYGVDFSSPEAAMESQLGKDGAIVKYALGHGFIPGEHKGLNLYATINAGGPLNLNAKDEAAGGTPGTVEDKWYSQMNEHAKKFADMDLGYEDWQRTRTHAPDTSVRPKERTAAQKKLDGWSYFADVMATPEMEALPLNTGGSGGEEVAMMAIPEF